MKNILPQTKLGKWSVGLAIAFFGLLATGMFEVQVLGQQGGKTFFDNAMLSIPMLGAGASIVAAFFTGVASIWKQKERAILVFLATLLGLIGLWFLVGEILVPH